jgi:hypothetical protein
MGRVLWSPTRNRPGMVIFVVLSSSTLDLTSVFFPRLDLPTNGIARFLFQCIIWAVYAVVFLSKILFALDSH